MTIRDTIDKLHALSTSRDPEEAHAEADELVLGLACGLVRDLVGGLTADELRAAFNDVPRWYS